jgi:hypothetical protein
VTLEAMEVGAAFEQAFRALHIEGGLHDGDGVS